MGKRSVKVDSFFPRRIFSPDIWGSDANKDTYEEYDEHQIISKFAAKTIPSNTAFTTRGQKYSSNEQNDFGFVGNYLDENPFESTPGSRKSHTTLRGAKSEDINYNQIEMENQIDTPLSGIAPLTASLFNESRPNSLYQPVIRFTENVQEQEKHQEIINLEQAELSALDQTSNQDEEALQTPTIQDYVPFVSEIAQEISGSPDIEAAHTPIEDRASDDSNHLVDDSPSYEPNIFETNTTLIPPPPFIPPASEIPASPIIPEAFDETTEHDDFAPSAYVPDSTFEAPTPQADFDYFALNVSENISHLNNESLQFSNSEFISDQIQKIEHKEGQEQNDIFERILKFKKQIIIASAVVVFIICTAILYLSFTGSDTPKVSPVPSELNSNSSSGEKPVILVPTDKDTSNIVKDQNGNVIGQ